MEIHKAEMGVPLIVFRMRHAETVFLMRALVRFVMMETRSRGTVAPQIAFLMRAAEMELWTWLRVVTKANSMEAEILFV